MADKRLKLEILLAAIDKATAPFRAVEKQIDRTSGALSDHGRKLAALKVQQRDVSAFRTYRAQLTGLRTDLQQAQTRAQALALEHSKAAAPTRKMTRELEAARREVNKLETAEQQHIRRLDEVRGRLAAAGVSTRNLGSHERELRQQIERTTRAINDQDDQLKKLQVRRDQLSRARAGYDRSQQLAGSMQGAGTSAVAGGLAVAAPLGLAAGQAMNFESAMADVKKVVNFPTPASFRAMSNDILDLSGRLPVAKEELAAIMAQAARAGVPRQQLLAFTEQAAKMGVAFDISSEEAGAMMATWRTAFGLEQAGVMALANQVNALTNAHGGNAAAVSDMVTRIGPLGDVAGASSSVLAGLAQVMNSVGVQSEIGATGIKNMLLGMTKGEAATKMQRAAFKALGLDATDMSRRMQKDAGGAIMTVLDAVAKLPKDRQLSVLGQMFGTESVAAIAPLLSQLELVRRNFREVGDAQFYAGSMDEEFRARSNTTSNALRLARNNTAALGVEIGNSLLPAITAISGVISKTAQGVRDFSAAHPGAVKVVAALVAILAAGLLVFGGLAIAISAILGPIALARLAFVQALPVMTAIGGRAMFVARGFQWMAVSMAGRLIGAVRGAIAVMGMLNATLLANPITWIVLAVVGLAAAASLIYRNWGPISAFFGRVWKSASAFVTSGIARIGSAIAAFRPLDAIKAAFASAFTWFQNLPGRFFQFGADLINGLTRGINGKRGEVQAATTGAARAAERGYRVPTETNSPSRLFMRLGRYSMDGLALGIRGGSGTAIDRMRRAAGAVAAAGAIGLAGPSFAQLSFTEGPRIGGASSSGSTARTATGPTYVTINVYGAPGQSVEDLAKAVARQLGQATSGNAALHDDGWEND